MKIFLKTRDECQEIVKASDVFYCTETTVQGFKVEMYDYRLASYEDFYPNGLDEDNFLELRGLTFVYNPNTDVWERHLALTKFFNLNQCSGVMFEDLKDEKIINIQDKRDGSMITFIKLPNGNIVAKTKMSFISQQAVAAQEIYQNIDGIFCFVNSMIDTHTCIFEYTSFKNQIVLNYETAELRLLQVRCNTSGEYVENISKLACNNLLCADSFELEKLELEKLELEKLELKLKDKKFKTFNDFIAFIC